MNPHLGPGYRRSRAVLLVLVVLVAIVLGALGLLTVAVLVEALAAAMQQERRQTGARLRA